MGYKYFIVTFLFGLNLWETFVVAKQKIQKGVDNHLIEKACQGLGSFKKDCLSTLNDAPDREKVDVKGLALFTLRYIESAKLTISFKEYAKRPNLSHKKQGALNDCINQYTSIDDFVKAAINDVHKKAYPNAKKSINAAISNVDHCDNELKEENPHKQTKEETTEDIQMAIGLKKVNTMVRNYLSVALNTVKAHN